MAIFQCISYADITARCLPGEREICGRNTANKKLITKSSEVKKPHGSMILFFALFAVFRLSGPFPLSPEFDANPILPANNVGSCPGEPECKLLCVNKISAAAIRTLWLSLPYLPFPSFVPFASRTENNTRMNHVCPLRNVRRTCVYNIHMQPMHYYLRRNTHRDKKYDESCIAQIFLTNFMFYFQFPKMFLNPQMLDFLSDKLSKHSTNSSYHV